MSVALALDEIQATVLRSRPEPYYGTHIMLRIDDRAAGRGRVQRADRADLPAGDADLGGNGPVRQQHAIGPDSEIRPGTGRVSHSPCR